MFRTQNGLKIHMEECTIPFTPIYTESEFKIAKLGNQRTKQVLSVISQMFISTKTVFYEVDMYDYYILYDKEIIGYFSSYKDGSFLLNCFLVMPCFQKQGWGTVLLDFAYSKQTRDAKDPAKSEVQNVVSAEKPYSKKAIMCFRKYWKYKVLRGKTVNEIAKLSNLSIDDVIIGLELNGFDFKKWKQAAVIEAKKPRMLSNTVYRLKK